MSDSKDTPGLFGLNSYIEYEEITTKTNFMLVLSQLDLLDLLIFDDYIQIP